MLARIQLRRDTATAWTTANTILSSGEIGVETDTLRFKIGDGTTAWNSLEYQGTLNTILNGTTNPSSGVGVDGDFYINTTSNFIFGPKASGAWPTGVSMIGPQGEQGEQGEQGDPGTPGQGVPVGGTTGQVLAKNSNTNYNTEWVDPATGDGTVTLVSVTTTAEISGTVASDTTTPAISLALVTNGVANSKLAQMGTLTIKGNKTGGTANAADLTATEVTAMLNAFSDSLKGLVPASGGGTSNFLRADGTWATPPGGGGSGTVTSVSIVTANGVSGSVLNPTTTPAITIILGAITPTSVAASGAVTGSNLSGTNTGDQTISLTGDVTGSGTGSFATTIAANTVTNAKAAQMATLTIKGNNTGSTANALDLTATEVTAMLNAFTSTLKGLVPLSGGGTTTFLRADGSWATPPDTGITALTGDVTGSGSGSVAATIAANAVTNAKAAQMATLTIKGNNTGGTANALDLTATEVTAMLNAFTSTLKGLVPLSGGGTANFLRADGTWATPPDTGMTALTGDVTGSGSGSVATTIAANAVTNAKAAQMATLTIKGNNTGGTANALDLTATQVTAMLNNFTSALKGLVPLSGGGTTTFLRADGSWATPPDTGMTALTGDVTASGSGSVAATIAANAVTNAKAAQMATLTLKGNNTGSTANALDLTATEVTAMLNAFTSTLKGLVPLSGGGTTNFLRADGSWASTLPTGTANTLGYFASGTGNLSSLTAITASRALASDTNGLPVASAVTATELGFVSGVTSAIQTQITAKAAKAQTFSASVGFIGTLADGTYTMVLRSAIAGTITETSSICTSGTATATFKINTTALGGTANSVSSTLQNQAQASANAFVANDNIVVTISSSSALVNPVFTFKYTMSLA